MGAGNQGGSSSAEDGEIRKAFSADKTKTAKDARDFFRDRDSGKTANMAYLDSYAQGTGNPTYGGSTNRDMIERQLGNQGLVLEGQNFVKYDEQGNRSTAGGINQKGNFWGSADLSGVNSPSYLGQNARYTGSRDRRYGSNADAMGQGTLSSKIQNSIFDGVTYNPDGTVTGMNSQQVYNPNSLFSGDPNRTFNMDTGLYETDESIGFDDSSPSILGRMARGAANYIGEGGILGALSGNGDTPETIKTPEMIDMNLGGVDPMRPVLRPTDGSTTKNNGIMNAMYKGINSVEPLTGFEPQVAGPYSGSAINPFINMNIDPTRMSQQGPNFTPQFNAQGVQVPGKKTLSELAETEPVRTAGFRNPTNVFDPQQRIIDEAMRPLGDRVSMYEDDPSIAFGFGGEPFDLSEGSVDLSETSGKAQLPTPFGNSLGVPVEELGSSLREASLGGADQFYSPYTFNPIGDRALEKDFPPYSSMENELANSTMRYKPQMKAPFGNKLGVSVEEMNYSPREDSLGGADQVIPPYGSLFADQREAQAARDFASGEGSTFAQMSEVPSYSPPYDASFEREDAVRALPDQTFGSLFRDQREAQAARDFASGEGSTFGQMSGTPAFDPSVPYSPNPSIARADERNFVEPYNRTNAIEANARRNAAAERGILIDQLERADVERSAFPNAPSTVSDGMTQAANREASLGGADAGPMSIGDAFKNIGGDLKRIFTEDPAVVARREAAERDENMYGTGMFDLSETYDPSGANNMNMTDAFKYIGGDIRDIFKESYNNAQTGVNESVPEFSPAPVINQIGNTENQIVSPASPIEPFAFPPRASEPTTNFPSGSSDADNILGIEAVIADARNKRIAKLGTATGFENNMPLEQEGPYEYRDPRIRDAMAPDGLNDNMYNDGSEIFDLSETYDPSGGGYTDDGGGGGSPTGCPEGYEPMTLENGETVCVPIEEEVEEVEEEVTPVTPTVRPAMGPSAYTPQAVSPIRPYTLQPGEQGVGSLADILQLQNYPNIV